MYHILFLFVQRSQQFYPCHEPALRTSKTDKGRDSNLGHESIDFLGNIDTVTYSIFRSKLTPNHGRNLDIPVFI